MDHKLLVEPGEEQSLLSAAHLSVDIALRNVARRLSNAVNHDGDLNVIRELARAYDHLELAHSIIMAAKRNLHDVSEFSRAIEHHKDGSILVTRAGMVHSMYLEYDSIAEQAQKSTLATVDTAEFDIVPKEK